MFKGTLTALITPFKNEPAAPVDYTALEQLIEWQLSCGVDGFVVLGTTGESVTLTEEEKSQIFLRVKEIVKGRVPLMAGTGTNNTAYSIELTKKVKTLGYEAALVVTPYYNKPTQEGLYQHFRAVTEQGGLPVCLYNIPGRSGIEIATDTIARLVKLPDIVGIKDASGSSGKLMELAEVCGDKVAIFAGDCNVTYLAMAVGGKGVISASANAIPKEMVAITSACSAGRWEDGLKAQIRTLPMIRALFTETNPAPAKAALQHLGKIPTDTLRLPLVSVKESTRELLKGCLKELG